MATPIIAGIAVAAAAYAGRYGIQAWNAFKARPPTARLRKFYERGFQQQMTKRKQRLFLEESFAADKVREAHRRVMVANPLLLKQMKRKMSCLERPRILGQLFDFVKTFLYRT